MATQELKLTASGCRPLKMEAGSVLGELLQVRGQAQLSLRRVDEPQRPG